jgi:hypothetical protein
MTTESHRELSEIERSVNDLFTHPPKSSINLRERLALMNHVEARQAVVNKLKSGDLTDRDGPLILAILDVIGIGQERGRLVSLALSSEVEARVRMWAAMALAGDDPKMMDLLVTELGPEGMAHLAENALIDLITIQQPNRIGKTVVRALEEWHRDLSSEKLLLRIEACRVGIGVSCAEAYGLSLKSRKLEPLWNKIFDFFVAETSDEGISFLESLRLDKEYGEYRGLKSALLRMRSAKIDFKHQARKCAGRGFVSNCDGNGGFIVLGVFENADTTFSVSELYLHVLGEVMDGIVHPRLRPELATDVVEQLKVEAGCHFVPVSIEESAAFAVSGLERIDTVVDNEHGDIGQALRLFARVPSLPFVSEPPAEPCPLVSEDDIRALLERKEYCDTWLFDAADLEAEGIATEGVDMSSAEWIQSAVEKISMSSRKDKIAAMAEHMSKWHSWNGEKDTSSLLAALADEVRRSPQTGFLIRHMIERSGW